ncbi:hypothetical protein Syun_015307 [Stephania yunnanensis]|uniref:Thioredoxin domain-containing protein n=1 Tax=Stephania yunnanensis TaxID=152371 RepID=A0AAP0JN96_9MAGN
MSMSMPRLRLPISSRASIETFTSSSSSSALERKSSSLDSSELRSQKWRNSSKRQINLELVTVLAHVFADLHKIDVVTGDSWDERILNSNVPVLVEFWAAWCGPCRMVHREIEEIVGQYQGKIDFYILKADDDPEIAEKYGVKAVPVVLFFKNGEKRASVTGTMPQEFYIAEIEKL